MRNLGRVVSEGNDLEAVRRSGQLLERSMARMSTLLAQLLHLARLDAADADPGKSETDLRGAVERCVSEVITAAEERHMEIVYRTRLELRIAMQAELLQMLLCNLLTNAVKYGRTGGQIVVRAMKRRDRLWLEVMDDGPGVPEERLGQLFDRFYRVENTASRAQGTGLGLAIVKRIAELHEAQVWAENRSGGGLKVVVAFPPSRWRKVVRIR
jgi:signal transduction histidine kinase